MSDELFTAEERADLSQARELKKKFIGEVMQGEIDNEDRRFVLEIANSMEMSAVRVAGMRQKVKSDEESNDMGQVIAGLLKQVRPTDYQIEAAGPNVILDLPDDLEQDLVEGELTTGVDPDIQQEILDRI